MKIKMIKNKREFRKNICMILPGSLILAFGLYNVHANSDITEGGVLGLMLLLKHFFGISPAYSGVVLDSLCYFIGWRVLGSAFLGYSAIASVSFSVFYRILELFPPLFSDFTAYPLEAAILGAIFVGVGVGLDVRAGGAAGGDDALAMALSAKTHVAIRWVYLLTDVIVLALSATYIPVQKLMWSLLTVVLSGQIIGFFQRKEDFAPDGTQS